MGTKLTRDELLVLLIEECGEVIQAATKCLRFGWDESWSDYGVNHEALAKECGQLQGVVDALPIKHNIRLYHRDHKMETAEHAKEELNARAKRSC